MTDLNKFSIMGIVIVVCAMLVAPASATPFSAFVANGDSYVASNDTHTIRMWNTTGNHLWQTNGNATIITELWAVGGGGSGGVYYGSGGSGGYTNLNRTLSVSGVYNVTVGIGGPAQSLDNSNGNPGGFSRFGQGGALNYTANGGLGGLYDPVNSGMPGINGGSGSGASGTVDAGSGGTNGGNGGNGQGGTGTTIGGTGQGSSTISTITGVSITYSGGGGGAAYYDYNSTHGVGGIGGGGNGSIRTGVTRAATAGTNGLGGGGGGEATHATFPSGAGGSGVVIVEYASPVAPVASFSQNKTSGQAPLAVLFTDTSTNRPMFWNWSVNSTDWSTRTWYNYTVSTNLIQTFTTPGIYNITLSVQNLTVSTDISTVQHDVQVNSTLIADFIGSPLYGFAPLDVSFVDFSVGGGIYAWNWSFGDGTVSTLQNPTHTYNTEGLKTILLIVTGADGTNQTTRSDYVEVRYKTYSDFYANNTAPIAFEQPVLFTPFLNTSADRYLWDWGEGGAPFLSLNGSAWHIYTTTGPKTVNLTAYRSDNLTATNTTSKVAYVTPTYNASYVKANFTATPTTGGVGLAVVFTDLSEFGTPGGQTYNWSFGDDYLSTNPYSNTIGSTSHVYTALGTYTVTLTVNNTLGIDNETKLSYITVSNQQSTTFYSPKTTAFHIVDQYGNQIKGATVTANFNQSNLPPTTTTWLVSNYGMNINAANEALNGALMMSGLSSDTGDITFVMIAALEYDLTVTYAGSSNHFMISPQNNFYQLKFLTAAVADNSIGTCVYANGNTHSGIARPDIGNITFMFSYQDTCGTTVAIDYYVVDNDLGTTLYHYQLTPVTTGIYVNNYTVSNVRGKSYRWWQNSTRNV